MLLLLIACTTPAETPAKSDADTATDSGHTTPDESTPTDADHPTANCRAEGVSAAGVTNFYWYDSSGYLVRNQATVANDPASDYNQTFVNNADGYKISGEVDQGIDGVIDALVTWERDANNKSIVKEIDNRADGTVDSRMESPRDVDGFIASYTLDSPIGGDLESVCTYARTNDGDDTEIHIECDTNANDAVDYVADEVWMIARFLERGSETDSDADGQIDADYAATYTDFDQLADTLTQTYKRSGKVDTSDRATYEYDEYDRLITYSYDMDDDGTEDASLLYDWICRE